MTKKKIKPILPAKTEKKPNFLDPAFRYDAAPAAGDAAAAAGDAAPAAGDAAPAAGDAAPAAGAAAAAGGPGPNGDDLLSQVVKKQSEIKKRPVGRPRKEGERPGAAGERPGPGPGPTKAKEKIEPVDPELIEQAALASAEAQTGLLSALFGKSFSSGYYGKDDNKILMVGFRYWYKARGIPFPPWAIFVLCQLAYFGLRFGDNENREAVKDAFNKFRGKIIDEKPSAAAGGPAPTQPAPAAAAGGPAPAPARPAPAAAAGAPAPAPVFVMATPEPGSKMGQLVGGGQPFENN